MKNTYYGSIVFIYIQLEEIKKLFTLFACIQQMAVYGWFVETLFNRWQCMGGLLKHYSTDGGVCAVC